MILTPKQVAQIDPDMRWVSGAQYTVNDLLETVQFYESLGESKSLCGHLERYSYTEDGGKHIICLLCEYEEKKPAPKTKTRNRKPRKSDGQTAGWIGVIKRMGKE